MDYFIGIDLGGTNIVTGIVNSNYEILAKIKRKTFSSRPAIEIIQDMAQTVFEAIEAANLTIEEIKYIGIAIPGVNDSENGVTVYTNNLQFYDVPIRKYMQELTGLPIYIANDANAAALGEFSVRKDQGIKNMVAITLGTGVGSGVIIDGKIIHGFNYAATELGHTVIEIDGYPCTCGRNGCFESYASATGLIRMTKEKMEKDKNCLLWELAEGDINKVSGQTAFDAMRKGDAAGKEVVDLYLKYLSCGITNLINAFQPEMVCIGGGISNEGDTLIDPIKKEVRKEEYSRFCDMKTEIVTAVLGNDAGVIGAAMLGQGALL